MPSFLEELLNPTISGANPWEVQAWEPKGMLSERFAAAKLPPPAIPPHLRPDLAPMPKGKPTEIDFTNGIPVPIPGIPAPMLGRVPSIKFGTSDPTGTELMDADAKKFQEANPIQPAQMPQMAPQPPVPGMLGPNISAVPPGVGGNPAQPPAAPTLPPPVNVPPPPAVASVPPQGPGMAPSAPTDVSAQSRMPPAGAMPAEPPPKGLLQRFDEATQRNAPLLLALAAGFSGAPSFGTGMSRAFGNAAPFSETATRRNEAQQLVNNQANMTARALLSRGADPRDVAAAVRNPELMKALVKKYYETGSAQNVGGKLVRERPDGSVEVLYDSGETNKAPSGFRWKPGSNGQMLEYIPDGPADPKYLREKGEKNAAPPGYSWVDPQDPEKGLKAIKGGPGEKIDAEVAGRLGLARSFLGQLPEIKRRIGEGELTGPIDALAAKLGVGGPDEIRRQMDSGAEALLRMLTGAGMNKEEASQYVRRYQFSPFDTAGRALSKMEQLERELTFIGDTVSKGRGGAEAVMGRPGGTGGKIDVNGKQIEWKVVQ